jgi:hypothetical protein
MMLDELIPVFTDIPEATGISVKKTRVNPKKRLNTSRIAQPPRKPRRETTIKKKSMDGFIVASSSEPYTKLFQ